ncbi:uncharacterized protein LOC117583363 [Drosophila guanche]|uniref:Uncharacterized protein n=1 Tax=Drosophila guanche TaxID=7266 RepID=A0A3B0JIH7_DROGU|nr:uncharacterized protein LOC117583363 [Drosophila guanche]SPP75210.1 Hypothetical predicted protein [Drosophila guanche]
MWQRKLKKPNWPEILDCRHALRKCICKRPRPARSLGCTVTCSKHSLQSSKSNKSAPATKQRLNMCWQLASDPATQAETEAKAKRQEKRKPKPTAKDNQKSRREGKPRPKLKQAEVKNKPQDALDELLESNSVGDAEQTKKSPDRKKVAKAHFSTYRKQSPRRPMDFSNILFLDARTMPWDQPKSPSHAGDSSSMSKQVARSKRLYGIPLCDRPSRIMGMGMGYPPSQQIQLRQEQLYQQSEYQDQYTLMLQSQLEPIDGMPLSVQFAPGTEPYMVPPKQQCQRVQKGQRYCGNFYYN